MESEIISGTQLLCGYRLALPASFTHNSMSIQWAFRGPAMPTEGKKVVTPQMLDDLADELRNRAALLAKMAKRMRARKVPNVEVMNYVSAKNSLKHYKKLFEKCEDIVPEKE